MTRKNNIREDVWKRIDIKGEDECWEWMGFKNEDGYGTMKLNNKRYYVHRLVYELTYGSIPNEMCALHTCDNPYCCNPKHLWLGTHKDNSKDMKIKGRVFHPIGEKHGSSKLTGEDVLEIREKYLSGNFSYRELGKEFNINRSNIYRIIHRKHWKHI